MSSSANLSEVFAGGATTSQHVEADDEDHFQNTTFKLKRTRSMGLLDDFIVTPEESQENEKQGEKGAALMEISDTNSGGAPTKGDENVPVTTNNDQSARNSIVSREKERSASISHVSSPDIVPLDDSDLHEEPRRHVDYLSHQWDVFDISKSWRYVISKRKDVANASRLENASWRTWAQRRGNLKTISPKEVNWSKDNDVTWLYGPILNEDEHMDSDDNYDIHKNQVGTSAVAGDLSLPNKQQKGLKPILKRRTVEDKLISHANLYKLELATNRLNEKHQQKLEEKVAAQKDHPVAEKVPEYYDYDVISAKLNSQYSNLSLQKIAENKNKDESEEPPDGIEKSAENSTIERSESPSSGEDRHIHFNREVQQCIALDTFSDDDTEYSSDEDYYNTENYGYDDYGLGESSHIDNYDVDNDDDIDDEYDDDEDEGGFFLNVRTPSPAGQNYPNIASTSSKVSPVDSKEQFEASDKSCISLDKPKVYKTIHLLPPTTLNQGTSDEESDTDHAYSSSLSHNAENRGYDYYYDYNSVYTCDPNHVIFGKSEGNNDSFDLVDVPENIELGSGYNYGDISQDSNSEVSSPPSITHGTQQTLSSKVSSSNLAPANYTERNAHGINEPINSTGVEYSYKEDVNLSSDSDTDSDDSGLSILTRTSSHVVAQNVFSGSAAVTPETNESLPHYPQVSPNIQPRHISEINSRHSSTLVSKQPKSTNSLSSQFFTGEADTVTSAETKELTDSFFGNASGDNLDGDSTGIQAADGLKTSSSFTANPKASPLPPQTTSANAFSDDSSMNRLHKTQVKSNTFQFDSDSESEDDFLSLDKPKATRTDSTSYAALFQVADKNGIRTPSPDVSSLDQSQEGLVSGQNSLTNKSDGTCKGVPSNLKNSWERTD